MTDEKRDWKRAVFGWAIDFGESSASAPPEAEPPPTEEQLRSLPVIDQSKVTAPVAGEVDAGEIFGLAQIAKEDVDHVRKAQELLKSLPPDAPLPMKRQIVEASLKAFGFDPKKLIEIGVRQLAALEGYIRAGAKQVERLNAAAFDKIQALQAEIQTLKGETERHNTEQDQRAKACTAKKLEVQQVLEFFGVDEVRSVVEGKQP